MLIAARTAAWAKAGGWVNPYVTDGLIAMWDGEWNAGRGVHTESNLTIKDIAGGHDLTLIGTSSIGENYFQPNAGSFYEIPLSFAQSVYDYAMSKSLCIEIIGGPSGRANNCGYICFRNSEISESENTYSALSFRMNNSSNGDVEYRINGVSYVILQLHGYPNYENYVNFLRAVFDINSTYNFRFGTHSKQGTLVVTEDKKTITSGHIGSDGGINQSSCRFYNIRFYNRQLSQSEITTNYAVDKARFNLL